MPGTIHSLPLPERIELAEVYGRHMTRTNIDIDDAACERVMRMYGLETKRDAINLALRKLAIEPLSKAEVLAMAGLWADRPASDFEAIASDPLDHTEPDAARR